MHDAGDEHAFSNAPLRNTHRLLASYEDLARSSAGETDNSETPFAFEAAFVNRDLVIDHVAQDLGPPATDQS